MNENHPTNVVTEKVRKFENFHILLWLLKDLCWVMDYKVFGTIMIIPTVLVAIYITIMTRKNQSELFHNLAVVCWISANSVWMLGEFFVNDGTRPFAAGFFIAGLLFITYFYTHRYISNRHQ